MSVSEAIERFAALLKACGTGELGDSESYALKDIVLDHHPDKFEPGDRVMERGSVRSKLCGIVTEASNDRRFVKVALERDNSIKTYRSNEVEMILPEVFQKGDAVLVRKTHTIRIRAHVIEHNAETDRVQVHLAQDGVTQVCSASELELKPRILPAPSLRIFASWFHDVLQHGIGELDRRAIQVESSWHSFVALISGNLDLSDGSPDTPRGQRQRVSLVISNNKKQKVEFEKELEKTVEPTEFPESP